MVFSILCPKDAEGMVKIVVPDQTSGAVLVCTVCLDISVPVLMVFCMFYIYVTA